MRPLVSVVIPVKNGQDFLHEVLEAIFSQKTDFSYEVIVIDSGSTDSSLDIIRRCDANLIQISPADFNHGLTRNLGVESSRGDFIAFVTQDATPANKSWLQSLVSPLREDESIAGVFGKHLAREDCDPIVAFNLQYHFDQAISLTRKCWVKDEQYEEDKNLYVFFSNNNSCIRRSVWEKIPFRDVEMSEDQWWAQDVLENGYVKCYEPAALVYHSHNYSAIEWFQRQFDEYRAYSKLRLVQKPSVAGSLKTFFKLFLGDAKRIIGNKSLSTKNKCYWTLQRFLVDAGMILGQFVGARHESRLAQGWQFFLSQQSRKINVKNAK